MKRGGWLRSLLAAGVLGGMLVSCGGGDGGSATTALSPADVCAPARTRHEHALDAAHPASLDAITIAHMEHAGAARADARDTATPGVDEIPFVLERRATRRFGVGRGPVARATLRDARGKAFVTVARGETSPPVELAPGAYTFELVSDAGADAIVAVAPDACNAAGASAAADATVDGAASLAADGRRVATEAHALRATVEAALVPTQTTPGVYVQEVGAVGTVQGIDTTTPAFVGATAAGTTGPQLVTSLDSYTAEYGAPSAESFVSLAVAEFFANGGTEAYVVATSTTGAVPTAAELTAGLAMLDPLQGYFTIALPDLARLDPADAASVATAAVAYGAQHAAFVVLDPPTALTAIADVSAWAKGIAAAPAAADPSYAAVYFPALASTVPGTTGTVTTGSSGVVTGIYAATDANVGPWESPSGIVHGRVASGATPVALLTDSDSAVLTPAGVNAIRTFPEYGEVIWGARTLAATSSGPGEFVPTRRTLLMIEQSIREGLQWVVFEPNDQQLWGEVTQQLSTYLTSLWAAGALAGTTTAQAFSVTCDASNNPPETRALGMLYVDVEVALIEPAEFVVIRIAQQTAAPDSGN